MKEVKKSESLGRVTAASTARTGPPGGSLNYVLWLAHHIVSVAEMLLLRIMGRAPLDDGRFCGSRRWQRHSHLVAGDITHTLAARSQPFEPLHQLPEWGCGTVWVPGRVGGLPWNAAGFPAACQLDMRMGMRTDPDCLIAVYMYLVCLANRFR
jgi:hypothetical protein